MFVLLTLDVQNDLPHGSNGKLVGVGLCVSYVVLDLEQIEIVVGQRATNCRNRCLDAYYLLPVQLPAEIRSIKPLVS